MPKDDRVFLGHMHDSAIKAHGKAVAAGRAGFEGDDTLQLALIRLVQIIGEAASRVSKDCRERHAGIPWRNIIGMRQRLVHDYFNVDLNIVWNVVTLELPGLIETLSQVIEPVDA